MARLNEADCWLGQEVLSYSLPRLRSYEWLWRSPAQTIPFGQRVRRSLDPLLGRPFSKSDLAKGMSVSFGIGSEDIRFAFECSAIEVNSHYAEAYVRRAIDGDTIFRTRGLVRRLEGWKRDGRSCTYNTENAILDTLIAQALGPPLAWTLRATGMLLLRKAQDISSVQWLKISSECLQSAANLARKEGNREVLSHCEDLLKEVNFTRMR